MNEPINITDLLNRAELLNHKLNISGERLSILKIETNKLHERITDLQKKIREALRNSS